MREVVTIQVGNCGCHIGLKFWEVISDEHSVNLEGIFSGQSDIQVDKLDVFYQEAINGRYIPRSLLIDTNTTNMEDIRSSCMGKLFRPESMCTGDTGSSYNFAKAFNMVKTAAGQKLMEKIIDNVYSELEACDNVQGIQLIHGIGGGTGSGLGSFLLQNLREIAPKDIITSLALVPTPTLPEAVIEPYNSILSVPYLEKFSDMTFLYDNEALFNILNDRLMLAKPTYADANYLVACMMSGLSAGIRFPGLLNMSMRKLAVSMIPQPQLHYFTTAVGPLINDCARAYSSDNIKQLIHSVLEAKYMFTACNYEKGLFLVLASLFRGKISTKDIEMTMHQIRTQHSNMFSKLLDYNIRTGFCDIPPRTKNKSFVTFIANHTSITDVIQRVRNQINDMFPKKKAFFHCFEEDGITEGDLNLACEMAEQVVQNYRGVEIK